jgi:hypothetical protein
MEIPLGFWGIEYVWTHKLKSPVGIELVLFNMCQLDVGIDINLETPLLKTWCWKLKVTEPRKYMI